MGWRIERRNGLCMIVGIAFLAPAWLPAAAQVVQCGPAAAVITTSDQQQALLALAQPSRPADGEIVYEGRVPYVVMANGQRIPLIPDDEYLQQREDAGGGESTWRLQPDPPEMAQLTWDDLPWSMFVHCGQWLTPPRSQGGRGICHTFAAAAVVESMVKRELMAAGLPDQLAEVDLSEEWVYFRGIRDYIEETGTEVMYGEGGPATTALEAVLERPWVMEAHWPYDPTSWPKDEQGHPTCAAEFAANSSCSWTCWTHANPDGTPARGVGAFNDNASPAGPLPAISTCDVVTEAGDEACLQLARRCIDEGRTVALSIIWPGWEIRQYDVMHVPADFPFDLWERKWGGGEPPLTPEEEATMSSWQGGGHYVQLFGYGRPGTAAEGIWMIKNSHGGSSGHDGLYYISENLIRASLPSVTAVKLTDQTKRDLQRFADTLGR